LGAFMTVCRITRNDAGTRIERIFNGQTDSPTPAATTVVVGTPEPEVAERDLEADARSAIMDRVIRNFKGHELEYLVAAVLKAQGYVVERTEKGADGGVDLTAGRGDFGFDAPRICVQVKSNAGPIDVTPLRELQGALKNFGADHGLFVAWGGFTSAALREARRSFFQLRLWSADDLISEMLSVYPSLPDDIRTAVPLQQIWTLVPEATQVKG